MSTRILLLVIAATISVPASFAVGEKVAGSKSVAPTARTKQTQAPTAQAKRKTPRRAFVARGAYFVPPPPAYMPSVLPELYAHRNVERVEDSEEEEVAVVAEKPKNPYVKYFYSRDEHAPKPVQSRNGVSTWVSTR